MIWYRSKSLRYVIILRFVLYNDWNYIISNTIHMYQSNAYLCVFKRWFPSVCIHVLAIWCWVLVKLSILVSVSLAICMREWAVFQVGTELNFIFVRNNLYLYLYLYLIGSKCRHQLTDKERSSVMWHIQDPPPLPFVILLIRKEWYFM